MTRPWKGQGSEAELRIMIWAYVAEEHLERKPCGPALTEVYNAIAEGPNPSSLQSQILQDRCLVFASDKEKFHDTIDESYYTGIDIGKVPNARHVLLSVRL